MSLTAKGQLHLEEPFTIHIIVGQLFFLFHCGFQEKKQNQTEETISFEQQAGMGNTKYTYYFLNSNCSKEHFELKRISALLQEFIRLQTQKACKRANNYFLQHIKYTLLIWRIRTDKTLQIKASHFHWYLFPFHLVQSTNTELMLSEDTTSLKQIDQMCKCALS